MEIKYLTNDKIDKKKWDACISNAGNSLIYGYSFYLDTMSKNWDALILNDYDAVLPLTWNKKYGIRYLYQPSFTQQLGIFSRQPVTENVFNSFITQIKKHFRFAEIFLNTAYPVPEINPCNNYLLSLDQQYQNIQANYKPTFLKSLKHSKKINPIYLSSENYTEAIDTYIKEYGKRLPHVKDKDYEAFKEVCRIALSKKMLVIRKVVSTDNELLAITLLLKDKKRLYNIMSIVSATGRIAEANYFLYDELIKEFSGEIDTLDFEGSDIDAIASFYKKFGAVNHPYLFLRYNNLPWPIKYLKK
jgi:hypothetical protein